MLLIISIVTTLICVMVLYGSWKSGVNFYFKFFFSAAAVSANAICWGALFGWEYGLIYGFILLSLFSWLWISVLRIQPLENLTQQPRNDGNFSILQVIRVKARFLVAVLLSAVSAGSLALLFHLLIRAEPANSLVGGLFLFLILWPALMVWVCSCEQLMKATLVSCVLSVGLSILVYVVNDSIGVSV